MESRIGMAVGTLLRCALENIIDVAFFASHRDVRACQFEGRKVMVKSGRFPGSCFVASAAVLPKFTGMRIIFLVTGKTRSGCALE